MVDPHVESLRRGRNFCEGITDIGTVDALLLEGAKREDKAQAGLFHASVPRRMRRCCQEYELGHHE
jgi:hypothetical protein